MTIAAVAGQAPLVSVLIPTLDAGPGMARLLAALRAQQVPGDVEIVVIDSGSKDGTLDLARDAAARIITVPRRRFGHGRTRNQAIAACRGEFVALTVQDALPVDGGWLARLLAPLLATPDVAGSYGLQIAPPAASLLARARSAMWSEAHGRPELKAVTSPQQFWNVPADQRLEIIRFDNVTSCIRRSAWERLPLPDADYGEDMGWALSTLLAGWRLAYVPEAQVWHAHERGWLYELRRGYADGLARVRLVDWPVPHLSPVEALAMLRRLLFFAWTHRFDAVADPAEARRFLGGELYSHGAAAQRGYKPAQVYEAAVKFSGGLTGAAVRLCPDGVFPDKAWIGLHRFATAAIFGQFLGANAAGARAGTAFERSAWSVLHWLLNRNV